MSSFSKLVVTKPLTAIARPMRNFFVNFVRILGIYKKFARNRVNESGDIAAMIFVQCVNFINHRPIGQIKYVLI